MTPYLLLVVAFVLNSAANIVLKAGSSRGVVFEKFSPALIQQNALLLFGLLLFASNVVVYFLALRSLALSVAYPIMVGASFVLVNGYAAYVLREQLTVMHVVGYVCILVGVVLVLSASAARVL